MIETAKEPVDVTTSSRGAYQQSLSKIIGEKLVASGEVAIHRVVRAGLPVDSIGSLLKAGVSRSLVDSIVKPRTLDHRKQKGEALSPEESDRLYRVAHLVALAESVFGDHGKAMRWLSKPKRRFDGEVPLDMALTSQGSALVEEMLHGIDHGFFA